MYIFITLTFLSTLVGGLIALKLHKKLHLLLGFTAGVILSVVAFDIFPEIIKISQGLNVDISFAMKAFVFGFLLFHIIEKYILIHHTHEHDYKEHHHPAIGIGSALALIAHSFLDGVGIGLAFQVSHLTGVAVAIAILSHDFSDGINTISLMLAHKNSKKKALAFLLLDAIAPAFGAIFTLFFTLNEKTSLIYLGIFAGFLLYISTSDILPEAHSSKSRWTTVAVTILGAIVMYFIINLITQ